MPRPYKPVELPLRPIGSPWRDASARCPKCEDPHSHVLGRIGLRLVFRCQACRVRFYAAAGNPVLTH